jgi:hypothetical protein
LPISEVTRRTRSRGEARFRGVREPGVALIPPTAFGDVRRVGKNAAQKRSGLAALRVARREVARPEAARAVLRDKGRYAQVRIFSRHRNILCRPAVPFRVS